MPNYTTQKKSSPVLIQWKIPQFTGLAKFRGFPHGEKVGFQAGRCGGNFLDWELGFQLRTRSSLPCMGKYLPVTGSSNPDRILLHLCLRPIKRKVNANAEPVEDIEEKDKQLFVRSTVKTGYIKKDGNPVEISKEYKATLGSTATGKEYVFEFNVFGMKDEEDGDKGGFLSRWGFGGEERQVTFREGLKTMSKENDVLNIEVVFEVIELEAKKEDQAKQVAVVLTPPPTQSMSTMRNFLG